MLREPIDFTGFSRTFQDIAVADKKYFCHRIRVPFWIFRLADYITKGQQFARSILPETTAGRQHSLLSPLDYLSAKAGGAYMLRSSRLPAGSAGFAFYLFINL